MKVVLIALIICFGICVKLADPAKILAVFPIPSPSHYIFIKPVLTTLAEKGHEVTVVGVYPDKKPRKNFREIFIDKNLILIGDQMKRAAQGESMESLAAFLNITEFFHLAFTNVFENPEFKQLMESPKGKFDLIIEELMWPHSMVGLGEHFNTPMIAVSPFGTSVVTDLTVGNISPNSIVPSPQLPYANRMTFLERLKSFWTNCFEILIFNFYNFHSQNSLYKKYFPNAKLSLDEAFQSFSLLLINQHHSLSYARPYVTTVIEVGGLHVPKNPTPLPQEMKEFLDDASHGAVYFSLGSNLKSTDLPKEKLDVFLSVFRGLKQKVLWKFENPNLSNKPDNVFISPWCPQHAVLNHPNVKVFITHGGLLSTTEAIFYGKPFLGIPVFYDQPRNIAFASNRGIALSVDFHNLKEKDLAHQLNELLNNPKYTEKMQEVSKQFHDKPMTALESAVYWTEYVLRYNGTKHLESATLHLNLLQYYSVDVVITVLLLTFMVLYTIVWISKRIFKAFKGSILKTNYKKAKMNYLKR